ncbi:hypothetical protein [Bosea sp. 124]|uniref:hypothetical protein n=1 Tax=Bosea sp. 124 TaxID=2135642 RepID=UPI000D3D13B4|nr:hypothetical protein [Bosea sp. 124]PTM42842.1 hypothetical protein C8D03_4442 [Bosea sp. 124]
MTRKTAATIATLVVAGLIWMFSGIQPSYACTKTNGCVMDIFRDDYDMKRDGRMDAAMAAGRANVEAFRAARAAEQARVSRGATKK